MLTMLVTPHTSEKPSPTRARIPPWSRPLTAACRNSAMPGAPPPPGLAGGPVQRRRPRRPGPDRHRLARLDLDDRHRLRGVLARRVEAQGPEERRLVEGGQGVAHLVGLEAAGLADPL